MSLEVFLKKRKEAQIAREAQWVKDLEVPTRCTEFCSEDLLFALLEWEHKITSPPDGVLQEDPAEEKRITWVRQALEYRTKLFEETLRRMKQ